MAGCCQRSRTLSGTQGSRGWASECSKDVLKKGGSIWSGVCKKEKRDSPRDSPSHGVAINRRRLALTDVAWRLSDVGWLGCSGSYPGAGLRIGSHVVARSVHEPAPRSLVLPPSFASAQWQGHSEGLA